ncbi:MAG TPA: alcohol dehydrogenase catalytic domain-containing protein [Bryobacteraceae bacterium]|jgi:L-iditol 2-dehydrogenase|nr:alcohol dehydrogenase catalytic domain-containing protein [Bryobacteraceae bacterium]
MHAAVYKGQSIVSVEQVPIPEIGAGEILVRVEACGICHTDLKKIEYNLLAPPRIYGHETAGVVVRAGRRLSGDVRGFAPGDRVVVFHHIPCKNCFYCQRKLYAQCPVYKKVGVTAGFEPAGGGFSQYVRVMDWIVERGVERIPDGVSFERASFVEPVNTCLKAVVQCAPQPDETAVVIGQGPIGLLFTMLLRRSGATIVTTDTIAARRELSRRCGALEAWDPRETDVQAEVRRLTGQRGADLVVVAASVPGIVEQAVRFSRPGARILLFAQTSETERVEVSGAAICVGERSLFGCYSASVDLQKESAELVFSGALPVEELISHRVPLVKIRSGIDLALHPGPESLKIIVQPQRWTQ